MDKRNNILFITDALLYPYDEGFRKFAFYLYDFFQSYKNTEIIILNDNDKLEQKDNVSFMKTNKLFLNFKFLKIVKKYKYVIYYPLSSVTFFSILRAYILALFSRKSYIIGLQEREYSKLERFFIRKIKRVCFVIQFDNDNIYNETITIESGIDAKKFNIIENKCYLSEIKKKYGIPEGKKIFLHVGHMNAGRNIDELIMIQKEIDDAQVVLVSSTSTDSDYSLTEKCKNSGLIVIKRFIDNISDIYNIADCYLFLVNDPKNFISKPLSVLEALACGIPVAAYNTIKDKFKKPSSEIYFFDNINEIICFLKNGGYCINIETRKRLSGEVKKYYSWDLIIKSAVDEILGVKNA